MNGGTNRGQADGFQLSVLNKIKDVKTQVCRSVYGFLVLLSLVCLLFLIANQAPLIRLEYTIHKFSHLSSQSFVLALSLPLTHLLIRCSFFHSLIHSFVRSFVHSLVCSFLRPSVRPFVRSFIRDLKHRRRGRQRERQETIVLISKTLALHVHYTLWYISLPSSAKQRREMAKFKVLWRT